MARAFEFLQVQDEDGLNCKDSCVRFLCLLMGYFGDRNIKWGRECQKNDLAEVFFIDNGFISFYSVSSDQKTGENSLDNLEFDWKTQNSSFRSVSRDGGSIWKVHWQNYITLHARCVVSDALELEIIRQGNDLCNFPERGLAG